MPDLSDTYEKVVSEAWDQRVVEPNLKIDSSLTGQVTEAELLQNALAIETNTMYDEKRLNTESVQTMLDPKGNMTCEAAEYFCKVLDDEYPESKFVHLNQYLSRSQNRELHAIEINVKKYKNIHFIFNRSQKGVFEQLSGHHWAVSTFRSDGSVFFGDGLYRNIPSGLKVALDDYYKIKFGKSIKSIVNLSGRQNFPRQNDSNLCGFIALMNMTLLENETMISFFNQNVQVSAIKKIEFLIFNPSHYALYLRQIIMRSYSNSSLNTEMFISKNNFSHIMNCISENSKSSRPKGFQGKLKSKSKTPGSVKSSSGSKRKSELHRNERKKDENNLRENLFDILSEEENENVVLVEDVGSDREADTNSKVNNKVETNLRSDSTGLAKSVVPADFVGKIVIKDVNKSSRFNHKVDSDGYNWKRKKNKGRYSKVLYGCSASKNGEFCKAEKLIYTPFGSHKKNEKVVEYLSAHSFCQPTTIESDKKPKTAFKSMKKQLNEIREIEPTEIPNKLTRSVKSRNRIGEKIDATDEYLGAEVIDNDEESGQIDEEATTHSNDNIGDRDSNEEDVENFFNSSFNECTRNDNSVLLENNDEDPSHVEATAENKKKNIEANEIHQNSPEDEGLVSKNLKTSENNSHGTKRNRLESEESLGLNGPPKKRPRGNEFNEDNGENSPYEESEYIQFMIKRKPLKLKKYEIQQPIKKYFVETSCAVLVGGSEGVNFDSHSWTDFSGGHGISKGTFSFLNFLLVLVHIGIVQKSEMMIKYCLDNGQLP